MVGYNTNIKPRPTYYVNTDDGPKPLWTRTNKIPVEQVFDIFNDKQLWFMIPDYPGYEISNYLNIRSFKFLNQYKYGTVVKIAADGSCQLTDKNNLRCKENVNELWPVAYEYFNTIHPVGYPKPTMATYERISARNKRMFIDNKAIRESTKKIVRKPARVNKDDDTLFTPHFTVVEQEFPVKKVIEPIYFM